MPTTQPETVVVTRRLPADTVSLRRIWLARIIAVAADVLQVGLFPYFFEGALSPMDLVLDCVVAFIMVRLVGWHIAFLPSAVTKLLPIVDLAPTWTVAAFIATRRGKNIASV